MPVRRSRTWPDMTNSTDLEMSSRLERSEEPCLTGIPLTLTDADHSCARPVRSSNHVGAKVPSAVAAKPLVGPKPAKKEFNCRSTCLGETGPERSLASISHWVESV